MSLPVLLDTNILVASVLSRAGVPEFFNDLRGQGRSFHICDQNLFEFWVVATRSRDRNGLGLSPAAAAEEIRLLRSAYPHLPNPIGLVDLWADLCEKYRLIGKAGHDTRLAAYTLGHGITEIVTFDASVFSRIPSIVPLVPKV